MVPASNEKAGTGEELIGLVGECGIVEFERKGEERLGGVGGVELAELLRAELGLIGSDIGFALFVVFGKAGQLMIDTLIDKLAGGARWGLAAFLLVRIDSRFEDVEFDSELAGRVLDATRKMLDKRIRGTINARA